MLRQIHSVQSVFRSHDWDANGAYDYWTGDVAGLYYLKQGETQIKLIQFATALADSHPSRPYPGHSPDPRQGYWFRSLKFPGWTGDTHPSCFAVACCPASYDETRRFTYVIDQSGACWKKDLRGRTLACFPLDPLSAGWTRIE
jgi:hypothetical protein